MTALGKTSPAEARKANETVVLDIATGDVIARTTYKFTQPWGQEIWVCDAVADHFDAQKFAGSHGVECEDTDEGRFYSLNGKPVAYVQGEYEPLSVQFAEAAE